MSFVDRAIRSQRNALVAAAVAPTLVWLLVLLALDLSGRGLSAVFGFGVVARTGAAALLSGVTLSAIFRGELAQGVLVVATGLLATLLPVLVWIVLIVLAARAGAFD